jgi:hypothetical protein
MLHVNRYVCTLTSASFLFSDSRDVQVARYQSGDKANFLLLGGDQKVINRMLLAPNLAGGHFIRWGVFPYSEVTTVTAEVHLGYLRRTFDSHVYHANDGGHLNTTVAVNAKAHVLSEWVRRSNEAARCRCELRSDWPRQQPTA